MLLTTQFSPQKIVSLVEATTPHKELSTLSASRGTINVTKVLATCKLSPTNAPRLAGHTPSQLPFPYLYLHTPLYIEVI
jgi:hypothetical protein